MKVIEFLPKYQRNPGAGKVVQFRQSGMVYMNPILLREMDETGINRKTARFRIEYTPDWNDTMSMVRFILDADGYSLNGGRNIFTRRLIKELPEEILGKMIPVKEIAADGSFACVFLNPEKAVR